MKMNECETESELIGGEMRCDFCWTKPARYSINGGLWHICRECMEKEFEQMRGEEE